MQQEKPFDNAIDKDIAALSHMALQHFKEGHLQQAQDVCQRILRKQQHPDAMLILGLIAHQQRELDVAVERYQQFLGIKPKDAETHCNLGLVLEEQGRTEGAIEHFHESIAIAADNRAEPGFYLFRCALEDHPVHRIVADADG